MFGRDVYAGGINLETTNIQMVIETMKSDIFYGGNEERGLVSNLGTSSMERSARSRRESRKTKWESQYYQIKKNQESMVLSVSTAGRNRLPVAPGDTKRL